MWSAEATATTTASAEAIWRLWSDVASWSTWDTEVVSSSIEGPFAQGSRGLLKPKGGSASPFVILEAVPNRGFTDRTRLPGATLDFIHELTPVPAGTRITHRVRLAGPLSFIFATLMGRTLLKGTQEAVETLARKAEEVQV